MKWLLTAVVALVATFGAVTWIALESGGVGVLRTSNADGSERATHVWYAEYDGSIWVEAATPERPFLVDLRRMPEATLSTGNDSFRIRAEIVDAPAAHERIRTQLRAKYGWRDRWVAMLQDTSRSVAVSLRPM